MKNPGIRGKTEASTTRRFRVPCTRKSLPTTARGIQTRLEQQYAMTGLGEVRRDRPSPRPGADDDVVEAGSVGQEPLRVGHQPLRRWARKAVTASAVLVPEINASSRACSGAS
jgi:hypothetical protein